MMEGARAAIMTEIPRNLFLSRVRLHEMKD